jgi:hypothetical protein
MRAEIRAGELLAEMAARGERHSVTKRGSPSFDHLVGESEQCGRNFEPERPRGL